MYYNAEPHAPIDHGLRASRGLPGAIPGHAITSSWTYQFKGTMYTLHRLIAETVDPNEDDVTQMLGCYLTLDEADLALDKYSDRYPNAYFFIE